MFEPVDAAVTAAAADVVGLLFVVVYAPKLQQNVHVQSYHKVYAKHLTAGRAGLRYSGKDIKHFSQSTSPEIVQETGLSETVDQFLSAREEMIPSLEDVLGV